jgi:hypothetical protein
MVLQDVKTLGSSSVDTKTGSPLRDIAQSQDVSPYILAVLDTKHRASVLDLGNIFEALIMDKR